MQYYLSPNSIFHQHNFDVLLIIELAVLIVIGVLYHGFDFLLSNIVVVRD